MSSKKTRLVGLKIVITPVPERLGAFAARREGSPKVICVSRSPFLDSARCLVADGYDPNTLLTMQHDGTDVFALGARLGTSAGLTVEESAHGPVFRNWRPSKTATPIQQQQETHPQKTPSSSAVYPARNAQLELPLGDYP
jgi:hypothetical protein